MANTLTKAPPLDREAILRLNDFRQQPIYDRESIDILCPPIPQPKAEPPRDGKACAIDPKLRAPAGWKRFKIRGDFGAYAFFALPHHRLALKGKYILAKSRADAEKCYRELTGLAGILEETTRRWEKARSEGTPPQVELIVTELPD